MKIDWTNQALLDMERVHDFLANVNAKAAAKTLRSLLNASEMIAEHPFIGEAMSEFVPRNVRKWVVGHYEIRYEYIKGTSAMIKMLRIWHVREMRV